ncbi:MAG TPA: aldose 1-epimerase family protein [Geothrix sp.]|nr:aldose 1-epimerase family protein [Geothrix sp.]
MANHHLRSDLSEAVISDRGAELQGLRLEGVDLLWPAGPLWPRHAPLLFPVIGSLQGGALRDGTTALPMPKHGFARERDFTWLRRDETACVLELKDAAATRDVFPFAFRLTVAYTLTASRLRMDVALNNPGEAPLPASLGLHPAFRWPLAPDLPKAAHRLVFDAEEPGPLRRLDAQGLLAPELHPTPIRRRELALTEELFAEDALLFLEPRSRGLRFEATGGPSLSLRWEGFPHLGVWAKPDPAPAFLCIEPWEGYADPSDWRGDLRHKPGAFTLAPGADRAWSLEVGLPPR